MIKCKFAIDFPSVNKNYSIYFNKEVVDKAIKSLKGAPILNKNNEPIGIITKAKHSKDKLIVNGELWTIVEPEMIVHELENNTILNFDFSSIWTSI